MDLRTRLASVAALLLAVGGPACGGGDDNRETIPDPPPKERATDAADSGAGRIDPGDPGLGEASPEAGDDGPETSELATDDAAAVEAAVRSYVAALNDRDGAEACALIVSGGLKVGELPERRGACAPSLEASIGHRRPGGVPAWKRTEILKVTAVSVGEGRARVTATVTHNFADRKYTSVEEDVVYLDRQGNGSWLVAKPSLTLYRAVGYPDPPLRALSPP